ncbi:membrane traffic protein [Lithospermum erythrorhizon]|uniref:Exocyst subunit Exo70 family protein n=1 Tax=Lithospermum erythrorhizon TaxID=34254 RepID=A0AAV3NZ60_LITER
MPQKGMMGLCFSPRRSSTPTTSISHGSLSPSRFSFSPSRPSFSDSVMDRTLDKAEPMILKWNPDSTTFGKVTSLFYENRREAKEFIRSVHTLQRAMHFLASENSCSEKLAHAQNLMQIAMKRLQKEFYQILSMNRAHLDPESVSTRSSLASSTRSSSFSDHYYEDDDENDTTNHNNQTTGDSINEVEDASTIAMSDLRSIAECMTSSGYVKECLKVYKIIRKSIIDEGIYKLGVEKLTCSQLHKLDYEVVELKVKNWVNAVKIAVKTLFNGERILCDHVFMTNGTIKDSIFGDISTEGAMIMFGFPEILVKNGKHFKKSPEIVFRVLDMYTTIADVWPEIESIFSLESTSLVKSQAITSLIRMSEFVRNAVSEFETEVQKDNSKSVVGGGGIHPLTIDVMNYLSTLADYSGVLTDIITDYSTGQQVKSSLSESFFGFSDADETSVPAVSLKFAWLVLVLLCKLDGKAKHYKDVSLSYLFLANNLRYVVVRARKSNLRYLLGDEWLTNQDKKVKQFALSYVRLSWGHVIDSVNDPTAGRSAGEVKECFRKFNAQFEEVYQKQSACVVTDNKLREVIKSSIEGMVVPVYQDFYTKHKLVIARERNVAYVVRFSPDEIGNYLNELFFVAIGSEITAGEGSYSSSSSAYSTISETR